MIARAVEKWVFRWLSGDPDEHCIPPGDRLYYQFGEIDDGKLMYTASTGNDGFEIWLSYTWENGYQAHYRAEAARQLAWFILWRWWGLSTWFGLKRRIWYWSLSRLVKRQKEQVERQRKAEVK